MNGTGSPKRCDGIAARLDLEPFTRLCAEFGEWRIDATIQMMEKQKAEGRVLGFVRGLKLSAHLIYAIRDVLNGTHLKADWGHILDDEGVKCSPECDVIIHRGHRRRWNGNEKPVMDFKFVDSASVVAVISCKSYLKSFDEDYREYCAKVRKYVKDVWLFAECCPPSAVDRLRENSQEAGYRKFWYLYTWDGESSLRPNPEVWFDFVESVAALGDTASA